MLDPILTKTVVSIPPALTFGVQIVLGVLVGPVGLAMATPLVGALAGLVKRLYIEEVLGDRQTGAGAGGHDHLEPGV